MLQCPMAFLSVLLLLSALPRALGQSDVCEYETNQIKDLLQASCEGKGLTKVPPGLDLGTGILLLGSNRLAQVSTASFEHLRNLTDLDLSHNEMGQLETTSPLPRLQELDLSHNALKDLPALQGLPNLVHLDLGHNALSRLPEGGFSTLKHLEDLELQGNKLQSLPEGAFAGLTALKDLDLSDNRLRKLPPELLAGLEALNTLRLERNRLRSVPEGFFPEEQIFAYVYLVGNPWLCDCALEYLRDWINDNSFSVYTRVQGPEKEITENEPENVTCHDPPEERGQPVMDFHLDCKTENERGIRGDEEELFKIRRDPAPTTLAPETSPEVLSTSSFPETTTAFFTQPEPSPPGPPTPSLPTSKATPLAHSPTTATPSPSPTTMGSLATTLSTARGVQTTLATSTSGLPSDSTTATTLPHFPTTLVPSSSSPITLDSLDTTPTTTRGIQTTLATSTSGLPSDSTTATTLAHSPTTLVPSSSSPTTLDSLDTTPTTTRGVQTTLATSTSRLPPESTTATPGSGEPVTAPSTPPQAMSTTQATPAPMTMLTTLPATTHPASTIHPPTLPPPAYCQCPILPGLALGLTSQQPSPVSWGAWLAARCCPLRLALYVACLVLVFLSSLAVLCWWVCVCMGPRHLRPTQRTPGFQLVRYQQLQNVTYERCHMPGEGYQPLPRRRLYRVCKRLEIAPLRYVTWLLVSLPGPSGQWPWERKGSFPSYSLDQGKDTLQALQVKSAAVDSTL